MKRILVIGLLCLFLTGCATPNTKDTAEPSATTSARPSVRQDVTVSDLTIYFTVEDDMLHYNGRSIAGYIDPASETLAERINEAKEAIGTISSAVCIDLTFVDAPPESIVVLGSDRYGSGPETCISNPTSTVILCPQRPYGYFVHSGLQYEWCVRIICSYPNRNVEYVLAMERNASTP